MSSEHHLTVERTARYYTLGNEDAGELWIVCHGYAQLARYFIRSFAPIDDGSRLIVAPEALNRYYHETAPGVHAADARIAATWMTREDREHEIEDYIRYLDRLASHVNAAGRERVVALGFSQGAATVSRWAAHGTTRIEQVILWGSPPASELDDAALRFRGASFTIAVGDQDPAVSGTVAERYGSAVFRYAGGHRVEAEALRALASS